MDETVSGIIDELYECALAPDLWGKALEKIGDALGGAALVMSAIHRTDGLRMIAASRQDPASQALIAENYGTAATNPLIAGMLHLPPATVVPRQAVCSNAVYFGGPLWNDVFRAQGLAHQAVALVDRSGEYIVPLGLLRDRNKEDFSTRELRLLEAVLPHAGRAMRLFLRMAELSAQAQLTTEAMDRLPAGLILCDGKGRVLHLNSAAQRIVAAQDGLRVSGGVLSGAGAPLAASIARVAGRAGNGAETVVVHRASGQRPHVLLISPVAADGVPRAGVPRRRALILIGGQSRVPAGLPAQLMEVFRLSPGEARLAAAVLAGGKQLEELAEERGLSVNTIKTQMKAVFAKTDTGRQTDLIRVLSSLPATMDD